MSTWPTDLPCTSSDLPRTSSTSSARSAARDVPVPSDVFDPVRDAIAARYDFLLTAHHFAVVGRCTACADKEPEHSHPA